MESSMRGAEGRQGLVTRQAFLRIGGMVSLGTLAAACAPTAAPAPVAPAAPAAPATGAAAWEREWNEVVAAAEKEGKVAFTTNVGPGYRKWVDTFQAAYPKITVQHEALNIFPFVPKLVAERKAGIYDWDLLLTAPPVMHLQLKTHGALAPIRPLFVRPDVMDDKAWRGGFEAGFADAQKNLGFSFMERVLPIVVNTDLVKEGEIKTVQDLLNPKWKGKILWGDVRDGATFGQMTPVRLKFGDEAVKRLMVDQEPAFSRDIRQMMEFTIRGQYAPARPALEKFL
ncbi:MAG: extracellular solute-binding protein, partial [Chloroflexota bacterium]